MSFCHYGVCVCVWQKPENEILSLLLSECVCGRDRQMSFCPYHGVCVAETGG